MAGREYTYKQVEGSFSQPNGDVCQKMLTWALEVRSAAARAAARLGSAPRPPSNPPCTHTRPPALPPTRPGVPPSPSAPGRSPCAPTPPPPPPPPRPQVSRGAGGDLLELYCGNGNFTIPLAQNFRRVVATELAKPSVDAAK